MTNTTNTTTNTAAASGATAIQRFNNRAGLMNPEGNGLYVRYEDHVAALAAPAQAVPVGSYSVQELKKAATRALYVLDTGVRAQRIEFKRASDDLRTAIQNQLHAEAQ